jgi:glycerophosphoryl diester phosphodiesterase
LHRATSGTRCAPVRGEAVGRPTPGRPSDADFAVVRHCRPELHTRDRGRLRAPGLLIRGAEQLVPIILSHRGNIVGPCPSAENRLPTIDAALRWHWGLETDIRRDAGGRFYISHDARPNAGGFAAEDFCALFRAHPTATIALNIKELGDESELLAFLDAQQVIDQVFLFDMELLEAEPGVTARRFRELNGRVRIAARVSDRGESIERALAIEAASVIWLDEFAGPHFTEADVKQLQRAGHRVHAVSPDLHGATCETSRSRWMEFIEWGVDGICTDYPAALDRVLRTLSREQAA